MDAKCTCRKDRRSRSKHLQHHHAPNCSFDKLPRIVVSENALSHLNFVHPSHVLQQSAHIRRLAFVRSNQYHRAIPSNNRDEELIDVISAEKGLLDDFHDKTEKWPSLQKQLRDRRRHVHDIDEELLLEFTNMKKHEFTILVGWRISRLSQWSATHVTVKHARFNDIIDAGQCSDV